MKHLARPAYRPALKYPASHRVAGLTAGFWGWISFSLPARAGYVARRRHSHPGREGASLQPPNPKPRWSPAGRALLAGRSPLLRGQRGGESATERVRARGSVIREPRAPSVGRSSDERDGVTVSGAAADAAERDASLTASPALTEPTPATPSERRAASESSYRPSAAGHVVRVPVVLSTHARAVSCAPPCVE